MEERSLSEREANFEAAEKSAVAMICSFIAIVSAVGTTSVIVAFWCACFLYIFVWTLFCLIFFLEKGINISSVRYKEDFCLDYLYDCFQREKINGMKAISLFKKINCGNNTAEYLAVKRFLDRYHNEDKIILRCIDEGSIDLSTSAIGLLTKMFKRDDTRDIAKKIIQNYYFSSDNNDQTFGEFTSKVKGRFKLNYRKLNESINELLTAMLKSGDKDIKYIAEKIRKDFPEKTESK